MKKLSIFLFIVLLSCTNLSQWQQNSSPQFSQEELDKLAKFLKKYSANTPEDNQKAMLEKFPEAEYKKQLSFRPEESKYFSEVIDKLKVKKDEVEKLKNNGMIVIPAQNNSTFNDIYYDLYEKHLPVFITTDSILYAFQRSYGTMLKQLEKNFFEPTIITTLEEAQALLKQELETTPKSFVESYQDVDLYLTVAQNLFKGGTQSNLKAHPVIVEKSKVVEILAHIESLQMQSRYSGGTNIYGSERYVDYSQFQPRGHYLEYNLENYFRGMMWLGRSDCGMILSSTKGVVTDNERELRNAILLSMLLSKTQSWQNFEVMNAIILYLLGDSDNIKIDTVMKLLAKHNIRSLADTNSSTWSPLQHDIAQLSQQQINSQYIESSHSDKQQTPSPQLFQVFGQSFVIDSFILANVVFDKIMVEGRKIERTMPQGIDVMAVLGNNEAAHLLEPELKKWQYNANLLALHELVENMPEDYWEKSCYNRMLQGLRILDKDITQDKRYPQVMQTQIWQRKQLATQLGTWAEMRHNNVLYIKQSYSVSISCEYPQGYVEPYPEFYKHLREYSSDLYSFLAQATPFAKEKTIAQMLDDQKKYLQHGIETLQTLEDIAQKQLQAQPLDQKQQEFIKKTVEKRFLGCGGPAAYDGWYCKLYYLNDYDFDPSITDIHTDPNTKEFLEIGTGAAQYCVIVIDSEDDVATYVGPVYSYYEFPWYKRMQNEDWEDMVYKNESLYWPAWSANYGINK